MGHERFRVDLVPHPGPAPTAPRQRRRRVRPDPRRAALEAAGRAACRPMVILEDVGRANGQSSRAADTATCQPAYSGWSLKPSHGATNARVRTGLLSEFPTAPGACEPSHEGGIGGGADFYFSAERPKRTNDGGGIRVLDVEGRQDESGRR
jgi:hypothetical protein